MEGSGGNLFLIGLAIVIPLSVFYAGVFGPRLRCSPTCSRRTYATPASPSYTSSRFPRCRHRARPEILFMKWNDGDPSFVCSRSCGLTSAASAFIIQRKHNAAVRRSVDGELSMCKML